MTIAVRPPADLLGQAIKTVRPYLDPTFSIHHQIRRLWAGVVAARDLGAADVVEAEFMRLVQETGLARDFGRHAEEDLRHVIRWGMLQRNPFD